MGLTLPSAQNDWLYIRHLPQSLCGLWVFLDRWKWLVSWDGKRVLRKSQHILILGLREKLKTLAGLKPPVHLPELGGSWSAWSWFHGGSEVKSGQLLRWREHFVLENSLKLRFLLLVEVRLVLLPEVLAHIVDESIEKVDLNGCLVLFSLNMLYIPTKT